MTPSELEKQLRAYELARPQYVAFAHTLKALLRQLLAAKGIDVVTVDTRAKTVESFCGKIEREDKSYSNPLNEITDLAGVRIVTYQIADIESVSEIINNSFEVDVDNSIDKRQSIEADRFGYVSVHYVVSFETTRSGLPEYAAFSGLYGEIQVRTVLQHAWAAIDHKLRYKSQQEIPANLRRQLYRISALLETADEEFESLTARIAEVRAEYSEAISGGSLDIALDVDSLNAYVEGSEQAKALLAACDTLNIVISPHHPNATRPEFSALLDFLDFAGARSLREFDSRIKAVSTTAQDTLSQVVGNWSANVSNPIRLAVTKDSLFRMAFYLALPPDRARLVRSRLRIGSTLADALEKTYRQLHGTSHSSTDDAQPSAAADGEDVAAEP